MLKIKSKPMRLFLALALRPCATIVFIVGAACMAYFHFFLPGRYDNALLLTVAAILVANCAKSAYDSWNAWFNGGTRVALVANTRTLAIVRFNAPAQFIKRTDCESVFCGDLQTSDGKTLSLGRAEFGTARLRKEFLAPLLSYWCPTHSADGIAFHLQPWFTRGLIARTLALFFFLLLVQMAHKAPEAYRAPVLLIALILVLGLLAYSHFAKRPRLSEQRPTCLLVSPHSTRRATADARKHHAQD